MVDALKRYFYIYITQDGRDGRVYIGRRISGKVPDEDSYMGSHTDKSYTPTLKKVLRICSSAAEAAVWEWLLHEVFDVGRNPSFANKSKARFKNFNISGMRWWTDGLSDVFDFHAPSDRFYLGRSSISGDKHPNKTPEFRSKMRERFSGERNPGFGKMGDLNVSRRPEVRDKISRSVSGVNNPMYGKPVSEDRRRRTSETMKKVCAQRDMGGINHPCYGLKWWTNGEIEVKSKDCPTGWRRGRKPK